ncbi:MAG TPA: hypothetical protein VH277_00665 [Gemmatimonadaceae bacterium]|nr:hypothetical protein [Gemmatimonadaceae bacterium]
MFLDDVGGEFRAVLEELLCAGDDRAPDVRATRLRTVARAHGAFRRRQGCPALVLSEEVVFAEDAIAAALMRSGVAPAVVTIVQESIAPLLRAIERASYSGYVDWSDRPASGL